MANPSHTDARASRRLLLRAERRLDAAVLAAIDAWLTELRFLLLRELGDPQAVQAAGYPHRTQAIDQAVQQSWGRWRQELDRRVIPSVSIEFGEAFRQARGRDPLNAGRYQEEYLATVDDRLRIWPEGAFEDIRPELLEALSEGEDIDAIRDRVGRVLNIDARTRAIRARINEIEARLEDPDTDSNTRRVLRATRRQLWEEHDESLGEWQWKARRIARTEAHGAVEGGKLAAVRARLEANPGLEFWKRWLCVAGDTPVSAVGAALVARRHYEGPAVSITTASGATVTLTPQHEVLTGRGWIPAEQVSERDHLFKVARVDPAGTPDIERPQATIEQVFNAAVEAEAVKVGAVPVGVYLNGDDATEQHVYVVPTNSELRDNLAAQFEGASDLTLADADSLAEFALFAGSSPGGLAGGDLVAGDTCEGDGSPTLGDLRAFPRYADVSGFGSATSSDAVLVEDADDRGLRAPDRRGDCREGIAADVEVDQVVSVDVGAFRGHVYDLSTSGEWFAADSLIIHNCTDDTRTRATHRVADGQVVRLQDKFRVGGFLLDHPGDPITIAPHETINCRCAAIYYSADELQRHLQGPKGSRGEIRPGGVRIGPDDPDEADRVVAELVESERLSPPPRLGVRGEDFGQEAPGPAPVVELTNERKLPLPEPDRPPVAERRADTIDWQRLSDDQLLDEMQRANDMDDDALWEAAEAEWERRHTEPDPEPLPDPDPEPAPDPEPVPVDGNYLTPGPEPLPEPELEPLPDVEPLDDDHRGDYYPDSYPEPEPEPERTPEEIVAQTDLTTRPKDWLADDLLVDAVGASEAKRMRDGYAEHMRVIDEITADFHDAERRNDVEGIALYVEDLEAAEAYRRELIAEMEQAVLDHLHAQAIEREEKSAAARRAATIYVAAQALADEEGIDLDEAEARVRGIDVDQLYRNRFIEAARAAGYDSRGRGFRGYVQAAHLDYVNEMVLQAEEATHGQFFAPRYREQGRDPRDLWTVNDNTARKWMSDEMREWFDSIGGRLTVDDMIDYIESGGEYSLGSGMASQWRASRSKGGDYLQ